jgi:hypothetical protein
MSTIAMPPDGFPFWLHALARTSNLLPHGFAPPASDGTMPACSSDDAALHRLPGADALLISGFPYTEANGRFAVRYALARTTEDILARHTRINFLDQAAAHTAAPQVEQIIRQELSS